MTADERTHEEIVRACFRAYQSGDRELIESLIAADHRFWSPVDSGLDRETYFDRCWANHEQVGEIEFERMVSDGDAIYTTYTGTRPDGSRFRNTELHTIRDGQVVRTEVYFGWDVED